MSNEVCEICDVCDGLHDHWCTPRIRRRVDELLAERRQSVFQPTPQGIAIDVRDSGSLFKGAANALAKFTFEAKYRPGDRVKIVALERYGFVSLVRADEGGLVDYYVSWWDEGKRTSEWLPAREIAP